MSLGKFTESGQYVNPRHREFAVHIGGTEILHYAGIDVKLEDVLRQRKREFEAYHKRGAGSPSNLDFARYWGEEVVWERTDVAAVILPKITEGGPQLVVYRFDEPWKFKPGREWSWIDEEPGDHDEAEEDRETEC